MSFFFSLVLIFLKWFKTLHLYFSFPVPVRVFFLLHCKSTKTRGYVIMCVCIMCDYTCDYTQIYVSTHMHSYKYIHIYKICVTVASYNNSLCLDFTTCKIGVILSFKDYKMKHKSKKLRIALQIFTNLFIREFMHFQQWCR